MTVFLILLAVAAGTAAAVLAVRVRRQSTALGAAADRIGGLSAELDAVRGERAQQTLRADTAEAERDEARARAASLDSELRVAASALAEAIRTRDAANQQADDMRAAQLRSADANALWALELARVERRWHLSVAPGIGFTSPLAECSPADKPKVALEIIASALREETGTRSTIDWQVTSTLPEATALLVLRAGDELLSAAAFASDKVTLRVTADETHAVLTLDAVDDNQQPVELTPIDAGVVAPPGPSSAEVIDAATVRVSVPSAARRAAA